MVCQECVNAKEDPPFYSLLSVPAGIYFPLFVILISIIGIPNCHLNFPPPPPPPPPLLEIQLRQRSNFKRTLLLLRGRERDVFKGNLHVSRLLHLAPSGGGGKVKMGGMSLVSCCAEFNPPPPSLPPPLSQLFPCRKQTTISPKNTHRNNIIWNSYLVGTDTMGLPLDIGNHCL